MSKTLVYPAGSALIFTCGEYSDFGLCGEIVTIKECDIPLLAKQYTRETVADRAYPHVDLYGFAGWLVAKGYAMPMEASDVHLGSYLGFEL